MTHARLPLIAPRSCGQCTACCTVMRIDALDKPRDEACRHLVARGCGIYETRPADCRAWHCAWQKGELPAPMRPDRTGVVEVTDGALERPAGRAVMRHLQAAGVPIAVHMRGREILVQIRGRAPMVVLATSGMGDARLTEAEEQAIAERRRRIVGLTA